MPAYLDELPPDTTMRAVFEGVHEKVHDIANYFGDFDRAEGMSRGETSKVWLTSDVVVETVAGRGGEGPPHRKTSVYIDVGFAATRLLAISGMHGVGHLPPNTFPSAVEGFWGADYEASLGGTYRLARRLSHSRAHQDPIEAHLGRPHIALPANPFTTVAAKPIQELGSLGAEDRRHFQSVTQGILDGIEAVELILVEGTPPQDVLDMLGRSFSRT
ncbi:MAG TPA: hypothetical protein VIJ68_01020 [Candidatus Saccharimonadales bacterium]